MADDLKCKLLIIGAGPGGYVCAIRAGQLGIDTIVVDEAAVGGTCLNVGCIPSKALIHAAETFEALQASADAPTMGLHAQEPFVDFLETIEWKNGIVKRLTDGVASLLKRAKVRVVSGSARLRDGKTVIVATPDGERQIRTETLVLATGSAPVELPGLPFGGDVISSTEALSLNELPGRMAVVGAGYIGLELGMAFSKLGVTITVIEAEDYILPQYDRELTAPVAKRLDALGVAVKTGAKALRFEDGSLTIEHNGAEHKLQADKVLVTVGRRPRTRGISLDELDLTMAGPFIEIDEQCRTSMRGVYAIGDVTGEPMLAHRAMAQGEMVAEIIAGEKRAWDKVCIPAVCFTDPEIVTVGLSPEAAKASKIDVDVAVFPFAGNGRAMTLQRDDGFVRVVARKTNGVLVGVQAVGVGVSELSAAFALAIEMGARSADIAGVIHAHPTLSEGFHEACLKMLGQPLHA